MQRMPRSFIKNIKERKKVAFFWKEQMPNPGSLGNTSLLELVLNLSSSLMTTVSWVSLSHLFLLVHFLHLVISLQVRQLDFTYIVFIY